MCSGKLLSKRMKSPGAGEQLAVISQPEIEPNFRFHCTFLYATEGRGRLEGSSEDN